MLRKIESRRGKESEDEMAGWHHRCNEHEHGKTPGDGERSGKPGVLQYMGSQRVKHDWATDQQIKDTQTNNTTLMNHHTA